MKLTEIATEYTELADKVGRACKNRVGELVLDEEDTDLYELLVTMFKLYDASVKMAAEQAATIDKMNDRLGKLLEKS